MDIIPLDFYEGAEIPVNKIFLITERHLDNLYAHLDERNRVHVFFCLLNEYYFLKSQKYGKETAYICYLLSYYLFVALTPPYSANLALVYAKKAVQLDNSPKYIEWLQFVEKGN